MTERNRRIQAVKLADALIAMDGVIVSDYAKTLSQRWADGELTGEQMKEALSAFHRKLAAQSEYHTCFFEFAMVDYF